MKAEQKTLLVARGVTKRFGAVVALEGVDLDLARGEIHAVVGENGAGKSTLAAVIAGFAAPDAGEVRLGGSRLPLGHPGACRTAGVAMVHQHFRLVPAFSVEENLALPRLEALAAPCRVAERAAPAFALADELGWTFEPRARVEALPVGVRQRLEVLKALAEESPVLILDEPTATLSEAEVEDLFRVLRAVRDRGTAVLLIAHKVREVLAAADRVTVLRRGRRVESCGVEGLEPEALAELMVGDLPAWSPGHRATLGEGLRAEGLGVAGGRVDVAEATFSIGCGEIVGFGGVDGNGQVELAEALAGVRPVRGTLAWRGGPMARARVGYIPQDRQHDGLALGMSVRDNLLVEGHFRGAWLPPARTRAWASDLIARFDIRAESGEVPAGALSGGNQQKIVVARVLDSEPEMLVAVNPTRGLDVRAARFVHQRLCEARDRGAAVALFSSDLDELGALADRVFFLSGGRLVEGWDASSVVGGGV